MSTLVNEITLNESEETPLPSLLQVKHCFCWSCWYFCQHTRSSPRSPADNNDNNAKNVRQRPRVHRLVVHPLANPTGLQHVSSTEIKFASLDVVAKKYLMPKDTRIFFKSHVKNLNRKMSMNALEFFGYICGFCCLGRSGVQVRVCIYIYLKLSASLSWL